MTLPSEPVYVEADPIRLSQIVGNLVSNACKFTRRGGHIRVSLIRDESTARGVIIQVVDTGIGIAADQSETSLEIPFTIGSGSTSNDIDA